MSKPSECCGQIFLDAEDFRDHLPCPGSPEYQRAYEAGLAEGERRGREAERRDAVARVTLTEMWHSGPATDDIVRRVHELILKVKP
jgi:hypothetical protein